MKKKNLKEKRKKKKLEGVIRNTQGHGIVECIIILLVLIFLMLLFRKEIVWILQVIFGKVIGGR